MQISFKRERTGSSNWTMILAICALVDDYNVWTIRFGNFPTILEHLPLFLGLYADIASTACPEHPGSVDLIYILQLSFRDADDP